MRISILIVNFNVGEKLIKCLESIYNSSIKTSFEVIVVENGKENLKDKLNKYSNLKYIISSKNLGYGGGNNLAARYAKGNYLFILNPDTIVNQNSIDNLYKFMLTDKNVGIVSPLIVDNKLNAFANQSRKELTPINSIFSFSIFRKIFPSKSIYNDNFFKKWNKKFPIEVDAVPGAAMLISKNLFKKLKGFDENFFLYFEENDLSKRVKNLNLKLYVTPNAKVIHEVGQSTKDLLNRDKIFEKSRFYFLKKHFGFTKAILSEAIIRLNVTSIILILIILLALILRLYNLSRSMSFIGDHAWFYLSARDMILTGHIPLVGITASHIWLHQGPLWTYMLSVLLFVFNFNPFSGAILTIFLGVLSTFLIYKITKEMFSKKSATIAAFLYATSPLIIYSDRTPYHTAPIPLFTILYFYSLYKWVKGSILFFPASILFIVLLYNFELATFVLFFPFLLIILFGFHKKKNWITKLFNFKYFLLSFFAFLIPMIPILLYDFSHGFKQTIVFFGWTLYKPLELFSNLNSVGSFGSVFLFLKGSLGNIIFAYSSVISIFMFASSLAYVLLYVQKNTQDKIASPRIILIILSLFAFLGIIVNKTPSDAYIPMIFPLVIILVALLFEFLTSIKSIKYFVYIFIALIIVGNINLIIKKSQEANFFDLEKNVDKIINLTKGQDYNLENKGPGSQFDSFSMNYEYLLWWKGSPPSKDNVKLKIILKSDGRSIKIEKND